MSKYLFQSRTVRGGDRNREEENEESFEEIIKGCIAEHQREMKFNSFLKNYLHKKDKKKPQDFNPNSWGKNDGEEHNKEEEDVMVEKYLLPYTKENVDDILYDDQLWATIDYSEDDKSAREVFDQWVKKFEDKNTLGFRHGIYEEDEELKYKDEGNHLALISPHYEDDISNAIGNIDQGSGELSDEIKAIKRSHSHPHNHIFNRIRQKQEMHEKPSFGDKSSKYI